MVILWLYAMGLRIKNSIYRAKLDEALHTKSEINNFLNMFSQTLKLEESVDSMNMTARYVADLVEAQAVCIFIRDGDFFRATGICGAFPPLHKSNKYVMTKSTHILESLRQEKIRMGEGIIGQIATDRQALLLEDASVDPRLENADTVIPIISLMGVPMVNEGKVVGVICAINSRRNERPFSPEQFSRLRFIASQVVLAQNLVQVYANLSEQQRINQELEFARQLQASLLPKQFPAWEQFLVNSFTRSSKEVSGDFYDFVEIDENRLLIVVGDACGKGIPACMIMAMTRSFIRSNAERFTNLTELLIELNDNLFRDTDEERFITLACVLLDKQEGTVEYARAGHTEVFIYVRDHTRRIYPDGSALGLLPSELSDFDTISLEFVPDMSILLFTDGITEAINSRSEEYGSERLEQVFKSSCIEKDPPDKIIDNILKSVDDFTGGLEHQADDQTMVIIHHL
jgi:sigma-B regulation protein RsbU (phosphoserine phosphatase)